MDSNNINEDYITEYIREITPKSQGLLRELEIFAEANHVPIVEPEVAQLLRLLIKMKQPKKILEVGAAIGYSALVMADAYDSVEITTIERNRDRYLLAEENIKKANRSDRIRIIEGDALEVLEELNEGYDLIFLDAAKGQYINFFDKARLLLNEDGLIISDNVLFKGMVATDELVVRRKKTIVKRLREYLKYINEIDGYTSSIIPIGDGVALTYREG